MSSEILAALIGPLLTALVTGGGVALREALQQRDARQKARRRLGEAKEAVTFIQSWVVAQESLLSPDERASMHLRVQILTVSTSTA